MMVDGVTHDFNEFFAGMFIVRRLGAKQPAAPTAAAQPAPGGHMPELLFLVRELGVLLTLVDAMSLAPTSPPLATATSNSRTRTWCCAGCGLSSPGKKITRPGLQPVTRLIGVTKQAELEPRSKGSEVDDARTMWVEYDTQGERFRDWRKVVILDAAAA